MTAPADQAVLEARCDGQRFVIAGLSRLSIRVATALESLGGEVALVHRDDPAGLLDLPPLLEKAGLPAASCFLALADDDLENLGAAIAAHTIAEDVPIVLSAIDGTMAELLESRMKVRRVFSPAAIAAPMFVAAALGAQAIDSMRLGEEQVPIFRFTVEPGSPLDGMTASTMKSTFGCALLGHAGPSSEWHRAEGDRHRLAAGDQVVVGGVAGKVLHAVRQNDRRKVPRPPRERRRSRRDRDRTLGNSLLPVAACGSAGLVVLTMLVFGLTLHLGPADALFSAVSTAFGSPILPERHAWLKVFAVATMVAGGALVGVVFAYLAAVATAERLEQRMGRRARRLHGHVIVAGLGSVGYAVERQLFELDIRSAIIERSPDHRYSSTVGERSPVLTGDVRLPETLERAGIRGARSLLACTADDLANIESCLQASKLNEGIRTVARIFDPAWAERAGQAFDIDHALSTSEIAARAFVGAAIDQRSLRRFPIAGLRYVGLRYTLARNLDAVAMQRWRDRGLRILAYRTGTGQVASADALPAVLRAGDRVVAAGPEEVVAEEILTANP
jgi:Trk K+ transport system NAD-binding subunit